MVRATPTPEEVVEHILSVAEQLKEQRAIYQEAARKSAGLAKVLEGYVDVYPEIAQLIEDAAEGLPVVLPDYLMPVTPKGSDAVGRVLMENPGYKFYVSEVVDALRARGWMPESDNPANAVRAALERLVGSPDSDVQKYRTQEGKVIYFYDPDLDRSPNSNQPPAGYDPAEEPF